MANMAIPATDFDSEYQDWREITSHQRLKVRNFAESIQTFYPRLSQQMKWLIQSVNGSKYLDRADPFYLSQINCLWDICPYYRNCFLHLCGEIGTGRVVGPM
jgi:hypothetical protein